MKRIGMAVIAMASVFGTSCLGAFSDDGAKVIKVSAKRFEYSPQVIKLKKGVPVVFQITTEDRSHGFNVPSMNLRANIVPGQVTELKVTPQKAGEFDFYCDVFCGSGHDGMNGKIMVVE